jgi:uncharacterized protein with HEPN domain
MTQRDPAISLAQMLEYARRASELGARYSGAEIASDPVLNLAIPRALEVIGEAASRVSPEDREKHPNIEWRRIVGFRNVIIHRYDAIDFDVVERVLRRDLPILIASLEYALASLDESPGDSG